jgi:rubrerythrin
MNREQWLQSAVEKLKPIFKGKNFDIPSVQVSVGWPSRNPLGRAKRTIGECWKGEVSADGRPQIFISPLLDDATEPMGVLATLIHEIVHAVVGCEAKHGPKFAKAAKSLGLEGKPTSTHAGEDLVIRMKQIAEELGPFPHSKIVPTEDKLKKQTTRMKKCVCEECGYTVRLAKKWMDEVGLPICPGGSAEKPHGPTKSELPEGEEPEGE